MSTMNYSNAWFQSFRNATRQSADIVVPILLELTQATRVVDVGCGLGAWLERFRAHGVLDYWGVDGDYVQRGELLIEPNHFQTHDLTQPLVTDRQFDLCTCLEVAEHLPARAADTLVDSLTRLAPIVCFSAAIPGQGGTHHINEQWPEYWAKRFEERGYYVVDGLRRRLWNHPAVDYWYAQNAVLYATPEAITAHPALQVEYAMTDRAALARIHPALFSRTCASLERTWDHRARRALHQAWHWAKRARTFLPARRA